MRQIRHTHHAANDTTPGPRLATRGAPAPTVPGLHPPMLLRVARLPRRVKELQVDVLRAEIELGL